MGRYSGGGGYGHRCRKIGENWYRISWLWDRYYSGSRLRYPQLMDRDTDEAGARRFCKKWNLCFKEEEPEP